MYTYTHIKHEYYHKTQNYKLIHILTTSVSLTFDVANSWCRLEESVFIDDDESDAFEAINSGDAGDSHAFVPVNRR